MDIQVSIYTSIVQNPTYIYILNGVKHVDVKLYTGRHEIILRASLTKLIHELLLTFLSEWAALRNLSMKT